ncbi:MAG: hypothetical protein WBK74_05165 [Limnochordia bacterium]|jgi:tetratricopeptide (TPR) repeat protein
MEYKIGIVLALIAIVYAGCAETGQAAVASFVDYHTASADVTWRYINTYKEQTVTGVFTVSLPDRFSLRTNDHSVNWQRIYGYGELTAVVARSGQVEYKYESVQPFTVYQALFGELIAAGSKAVTYVSDEVVGGRPVARYQSAELTTYWFDRETNIPLRITDETGRNILSLRQYQVDADHKQGVEFFTLALREEAWEGTIRIGRSGGHWFPLELRVSDAQSEIVISFSNWRVDEQPLALKDLEQLKQSLAEGKAAVEQGDHHRAIYYFRQLLNIDPFYVPAYRELAHSYLSIGSYLGAVENYQQWLMLEPDNPVAMNNLAYTFMLAQSNLPQAINLAYQAVSREPRASFLDTLGYGYYLVGDYGKALHYLLQAEAKADDHELPEVFGHLILVYEALDDQVQAGLYRERLLALTVGE